ncbi:MAG: glycosyltransferase family 1 protein [Rhodobiaceae bacterium]|nr:glycosyltransferase family 1 protein [Rhodobiaceae bacterium]
MTETAEDGAGPAGKGRILEIGEIELFSFEMADRTDAFYTSYRADLRRGRPYLGVINLWKAVRAAWRGEYDLIVLSPPFYPGWHPRSFLAALKFTLLRGRIGEAYGAVVSPLLFQALRFIPLPQPLIALELTDSFGIARHQHFLLDKATVFCKRELPVDHWKTLFGSAHRRLPGRRVRMSRRWQQRVAKLRPIGTGFDQWRVGEAGAVFGCEKTSDVFFMGDVAANSTARREAPRLIAQLREAGFKVDFPDTRLDYPEYIRRCAQSWITLSPEGFGWECYRHIEAAIAGSVPLVSVPTIHRYKPLVIGRHCLVYYPDEDNIVEVVRDALSDKARLGAIAQAAHEHAVENLTTLATARDLLRTHGRNRSRADAN